MGIITDNIQSSVKNINIIHTLSTCYGLICIELLLIRNDGKKELFLCPYLFVLMKYAISIKTFNVADVL